MGRGLHTLDTPLDPTNANRYAYDDPINNIDPMGLRWWTCALGTLGYGVGFVSLFCLHLSDGWSLRISGSRIYGVRCFIP